MIRYMRRHRAGYIALCIMLAIYAISLCGCASLRGPMSLADTQAAVIGAGGNADADTLLDYANALFHAGNVAQAAKVLDDMPDAARQSPRWLVLHGATRGELGDKIGAKADFTAAADLGSDAARQNLAKLEGK